jgi:hypothetical protein
MLYLPTARDGRIGKRLLGITCQFDEFLKYLLLIHPEKAGVRPHKSLIDDTPGQLVEFLIFERFQDVDADFGGAGNGREGDAAYIPFMPQTLAK